MYNGERSGRLDYLSVGEPAHVDARWLAIARTQIELGFMAMNRAITINRN